MDNEEIAKNISTLIKTFNDKRVVSEGDLKLTLQAIVAILAANKQELVTLTSDTKQTTTEVLSRIESLDLETQVRVKSALVDLEKEYQRYAKNLKSDATLSKDDIEKAVKAQNDRAFKRLQTILTSIKVPKDGKDGAPGEAGTNGIDGSPDTPEQVRDKLETLKDENRLDWTAIKGLPDYFKMAKKAGRQMLVGGIRFFENLVDVSILPTKKRQDLLVQYNKTNNRWENGIALTVSTTEPTSPEINDLWVDTN